jgi:hypothetical protein
LKRTEGLAFAHSGLKKIVIPSGIEFIDGSAFINVYFTSIWMSDLKGQFAIVKGFLQDVSGRSIYRFVRNSRSVMIRPSVRVLDQSSFAACKSLESVEFEKGSEIEIFGASAFSGSGLESIVIPSSVIVLSQSSFSSCH